MPAMSRRSNLFNLALKHGHKIVSGAGLPLMLSLCLCLSLAAAAPALAQSTDVEPDVTIRQQEDRTIEEYRVNGQLYAIKITPKVGPSYFLIDEDGDGNFARQSGDQVAIPSWVLVEW
ncbi:DUF2782 domain-containing protein [Onishia taeanensis]|uniref:Uncharacterized protein DUF2782 n=1 Tax=Onishia taeanensis TaxID=284577 RepID=A0A328XUD5_9GAMM|nr:DUF2782 domain-containing protein [Halomonas taeanensis]RAR60803.1 uncharacterized protein DUF2782 [Halomonas taeanensis]